MRILVAEDDLTSARILTRTLEKSGHEVEHAENGALALALLKQNAYALLVTDWMMPEMDGITLLKQLRQEVTSPPPSVMITALSSESARNHALESGADEFLPKPIRPQDVLKILDGLIQRTQLEVEALKGDGGTSETCVAAAPAAPRVTQPARSCSPPPGIPLVLATSSGGPTAIRELMKSIDSSTCTTIVMHGQPWLIQSLVPKLASEIDRPVQIIEHDMPMRAGEIFVAPGDQHLSIASDPWRYQLDDGEPINFVRPSADRLLVSFAENFGSLGIAAILTGRGCDGAQGARALVEAEGKLFVQDPNDAQAAGMPQSVISSGVECGVLPLAGLADAINQQVRLTEQRVAKPVESQHPAAR